MKPTERGVEEEGEEAEGEKNEGEEDEEEPVLEHSVVGLPLSSTGGCCGEMPVFLSWRSFCSTAGFFLTSAGITTLAARRPDPLNARQSKSSVRYSASSPESSSASA